MDASLRQKSLAAATGAVMAVLGIVGCDKLQSSSVEADRAAVANVKAGKLDAAAAEKGASPEIRTTVNRKLSTQRYAEGTAAYSQILDARMDAARLSGQAGRFAAMAELNLDSARDLSRYEPAPSLLVADQVIGDIRGASDKMTRTVAGVEMPTQTAIDANIEKLNASIAATQKQIDDLQARQQQLSQAAAKAEAESRDAKGQKAVDLYKQAVASRQQATEAAVNVEITQAKLLPLQQDLATAMEQKESLVAAVKEVDALKGRISEGWQVLSQEKGKRTRLAESLVGKAPESNRPNLAITVKELDALGRDNEATFKKAADAYAASRDSSRDAAAAAAQAAKTAGDQLAASRGTSREALLKDMQNTFNPAAMKLNENLADYSLGRMQADQAAMLQTRAVALKQLSSLASRVSYTVPGELPKADQVATDGKEAAQTATETLKRADAGLRAIDDLRNVSPAVKQSAAVARMMDLLSLSEVAKNSGNAALATQAISDAKAVRGSLGADAKLPELPAPLNQAE